MAESSVSDAEYHDFLRGYLHALNGDGPFELKCPNARACWEALCSRPVFAEKSFQVLGAVLMTGARGETGSGVEGCGVVRKMRLSARFFQNSLGHL